MAGRFRSYGAPPARRVVKRAGGGTGWTKAQVVDKLKYSRLLRARLVREQLALKRASTQQREEMENDAGVEPYRSRLAVRREHEETLWALADEHAAREEWPEHVRVLSLMANLARGVDERVSVWHRLADVLADQLQEEDPAIATYRAILEQRGDDEEALWKLRALLNRREDWGGLAHVLLQLAQVVQEDEERLSLRYERARLLEHQLGEVDAAISEYRVIVEERENEERALRELVRLYGDREQWEEQGQILSQLHEALGTQGRPMPPPDDPDEREVIETLDEPLEKRFGFDTSVRAAIAVLPAADEPLEKRFGFDTDNAFVLALQGFEDLVDLKRGEDVGRPAKKDFTQGVGREAEPSARRHESEESSRSEPGEEGDLLGRKHVAGKAPSIVASAAVAPVPPKRPLYWNVGFPEDRAVNQSLLLIVGCRYRLRLSIDDHERVDSLEGQAINPSTLGLSDDTPTVPVQFVVRLDGGAAELLGADGVAGSYWESDELECDIHKGTNAVCLTLNPTAGGLIVLSLALRVRCRPALDRTVTLNALDLEQRGPLPEPARRAPLGRAIDGDLSGAPEVDLSLELWGSDSIQLVLRTPGFVVPPVDSPSTKQALVRLALNARGKLIACSQRYRHATGAADPVALQDGTAMVRKFAELGQQLYRGVFGRGNIARDLIAVADLLKASGSAENPSRLSIYAELLPLPWALLYDRKLDPEGPVDIEGFWGSRFIIARGAKAYLDRIPLSKLKVEANSHLSVCLNPHIDDEEKIEVLKAQRTFLDGLRTPLTAGTAIESRDSFQTYLQTPIQEPFWYFFCHGHAAETVDENMFLVSSLPWDAARLRLDAAGDEKDISVSWMWNAHDRPLGPVRPFVFLNACSSVQGDEAFQSLFVKHFLNDWGACGLLGTEWRVPALFADHFGRHVLELFLQGGQTIGQAVQSAVVHALKRDNPFGLIYSLYGNSQTHIDMETDYAKH